MSWSGSGLLGQGSVTPQVPSSSRCPGIAQPSLGRALGRQSRASRGVKEQRGGGDGAGARG